MLLGLSHTDIAEVTQAGARPVRERLTRRGYDPLGGRRRAAGGSGRDRAVVPGAEVVNQLDPSLPHDYFDNLLNNCGPACVSMVMLQAKGVRVYPDEICDWMYGEGHRGYTFTNDLERYLDAHGVPATQHRPPSLPDIQRILRSQVAAGRLTIGLFYQDYAGRTGGHFKVCYGVDEGPGKESVWLNPWHGVYDAHTWERVADEILGMGSWLITADKGYAGGYRSYAESWRATFASPTNVRSGPGRSYGIIALAPKGDTTKLTRYTDDGEAIATSAPHETRWHFTAEYGGWCYNGGFSGWKRA